MKDLYYWRDKIKEANTELDLRVIGEDLCRFQIHFNHLEHEPKLTLVEINQLRDLSNEKLKEINPDSKLSNAPKYPTYELAYVNEANPSFRLMEDGEYRKTFDYEFSDKDEKSKTYIGNPSYRRCRFCKRHEDQTTFKKTAHIIPASMGNRYLFTYEECDECNQAGGHLEDSFAKIIQLPRALGNSRTSSQAHSKFKTKHGSTIESSVDGQNRKVNYKPGDPYMNIRDLEDGTLRISTETQKLSYRNVGKALVRLGLNLMPDHQLGKFEHLRQWVLGNLEVVYPFFYYVVPVEGEMRKTKLTLFKRARHNSNLAPFLLAFTYKILIFVMPIPDVSFEVKEAVIPDMDLPGERQASFVACNYNINGEAKFEIFF